MYFSTLRVNKEAVESVKARQSDHTTVSDNYNLPRSKQMLEVPETRREGACTGCQGRATATAAVVNLESKTSERFEAML